MKNNLSIKTLLKLFFINVLSIVLVSNVNAQSSATFVNDPEYKELLAGCNQGIEGNCYYVADYWWDDGKYNNRKGNSKVALKSFNNAFKFFKRSCDILKRDPSYSSCTREGYSKVEIDRIVDPGKEKRVKEANKRIVDAVRGYINKDCSRMGLLTKSGSQAETRLTALTSSFRVKDGVCVADNGITKHSIGISGIYDLKCDSSTSATRNCQFGIYVYCRITSKIGKWYDNEKVSNLFCDYVFPVNYSGKGTFVSTNNGASFIAKKFTMFPVPLQ